MVFSISFIPPIFFISDSSLRNICLFSHLFIYSIIYLYHQVMNFYIIICSIIQYSLYFVPMLAIGSLYVFFEILPFFFSTSVISDTSRCSRIILYCLDPRITFFSMESWFLFSENGI